MFGFRELDIVLRGEMATPGPGSQSGPTVSLGPLLRVIALLAVGYGLCMGIYSICSREESEYRQLLASAFKVPSLFLLTLLVTFPSLYVFNTLLGSKLRVDELARMLAGAMGVLIAVLAAFGPIVAFFSFTTSSYAFIVLLNVAFFAIAGAFGFAYLLRSLGRLAQLDRDRLAEVGVDEDEASSEKPRSIPRHHNPQTPMPSVFKVWVAVFMLVGSQMSWILRPFIGSPHQPFSWFRHRESSFLESLLSTAKTLFTEG